MNKEEIDKAINMLNKMNKLRYDLTLYLLNHLDNENFDIFRNLVKIQLFIEYIEYELNNLKEVNKNECIL